MHHQRSMALKLSVDLLKLHRLKSKTRSYSDMPLRFVQFQRGNDPQAKLGVISKDGRTLVPLPLENSNDMIGFISQDMDPAELVKIIKSQPSEEMSEQLTLLPPVTSPEKIICLGLNYQDHCEEQDKPKPKYPIFFSKFASTLVGPTGNVIAHKISNKIDWEVELAVIIGKEAKHVPREKAFDYIFGYSAAQDISARDWQGERNGRQFLIGKSMDTFCPLGPAIVHKSLIDDPHNLQVITRINGVEKQNGNTKDMIFRIDELIERLTRCITLKPGDLILTGTPGGVGMYRNPPEYLKVGDVIESEIQSIGKLINKVVDG